MKYIFITSLLVLSLTTFSQDETRRHRTIKVLSFNILHGATTQGDFDLDAIANVIKESDPDLVALQEVDFLTNRAKKYDLATELGWRTSMASIFARAMPYDGGEYGEAVLSKWSFISSRNIPLPHSEGNEPRAALEVTVVTDFGDTISFIGTHLDHLRDEIDRVSQVKQINAVFADNRYPTILTGDLNDIPGSRAISILEQVWTPSYNRDAPEPTFPSLSPRKKIDYVMYLPGDSWRVINRQVIRDTIASDHCAYLVTLELLEE